MIYNAFSSILNKVTTDWPIVYTDDMLDFTQADLYADKYPFVWFVNKTCKVKEDFPFAWRPPVDQRLHVHTFPRCDATTKAPLRWDVIKLVPTSNREKLEVKQPIIASYNANKYQVFAYAMGDVQAMRKFKNVRKDVPEAQLIKNDKTFDDVMKTAASRSMTDYVWLIDTDITLENLFELDFVPSKKKAYMWKTTNSATGQVYPNKSLMLVHRSLLKKGIADSDVEVVDVVAGKLNAATDPLRAWSRAFTEAVVFTTSNPSYVDTKELLKPRKTLVEGRLASYISKGTITGLAYAKQFKGTSDLDNVYNIDWLKDEYKKTWLT